MPKHASIVCDRREVGRRARIAASLVMFSVAPMLGAMAGALVDERYRSGVTVWRSACRASGLSPSSVFAITFELLPCGVIGALVGGLLVLAWTARGGLPAAPVGLAAHGGCLVAMPAMVLLCALPLPLPWVLALESLLGVVIAAGVLFALRGCAAARD